MAASRYMSQNILISSCAFPPKKEKLAQNRTRLAFMLKLIAYF